LNPATVAWWETGGNGEVTSWLVVGAGSPPLAHQAWVRQAAFAGHAPGAWAFAVAVPLWELGHEIASRLHDPAGRGRPGLRSVAFGSDGSALEDEASAELYDACRSAAAELVATRMQDESFTLEPTRSGIALLRLRAEGGGLVLDLAPAIDEPGWLGRPIGIDVDAIGALEKKPTFGTETVSLVGREAELPCALIRFKGAGADRDATVRVTLPGVSLPGAPDPVVCLPLRPGGH
jgi:hypothetical protein